MNKIQNIYYKFLIISCLLLINTPYLAHSQESNTEINFSGTEVSDGWLKKADSLFVNKKYTESYKVYRQIFDNQRVSPQMLLKMAYIQEGLGNYGSALYYLNLYYLESSNKRVLQKMEALAAKHQLTGYAYTDAEYFLNFYYKYQWHAMLAIISVVLLIFSLIYYKKKTTQRRPVVAGIVFVFILAALYFQVNYGIEFQKGIIMNPHSYLMNGPSSGADLIGVVKQGHRVDILGKEDVWVKINWNGQEAYIREGNIDPVRL